MRLPLLKSLILRAVAAFGYEIVRAPPKRRRISAPLNPNPAIFDANRAILRDAKVHLDQSVTSDDLPSFGDRWGAYAKRLRKRIATIRSSEDLLLLGQSPQAGIETHLSSAEMIGFCQWSDMQSLADGLPDELLTTLPSFAAPPMTPFAWLVEYRGRKIDFVSACAASTILRLLHWLEGDRPRSVCDIGGGTGKYAYAWLTNAAHRPDLVVILDIPETLIYSETLLRNAFGDDAVQYITDPAMVPNRSGVVLCPVGNAKAIEGVTFDLVTNVGSMQEMPDGWIDWYMAWLDRQPCRYFYSNNYFGNALTNMNEGHCSWAPRPSARWTLLSHRLNLGMRTHAQTLFKRDTGPAMPVSATPARGVDAWFTHLEQARLSGDEAAYRRALDFARTSLPFVPKETWQVAKMLSGLTGTVEDAAGFEQLDRLRRSGLEAAH
jgi:hypothetical protein